MLEVEVEVTNLKMKLLKNKKAMFENLSGLALGLVVFAVIIGVGATVLLKFSTAVVTCDTGYAFSENISGGGTATCYNVTNTSQTIGGASDGWTSIDYLNTELGSSGLAGWTPAIVAISVGVLFIGALAFLGVRKKY